MAGVVNVQSMFTLEQTVLHGLAKFCWGKFILREHIKESVDSRKCLQKLISYRDEVVNKVRGILNGLHKTPSLTLPQKVIDKVINAVHNLLEGYEEAIKWEQKFEDFLPFTILNPSTQGSYQAGNFIDANRHFNDFEWAKKFVSDEDQLIQTRFKFACNYCLEEDIVSIWNIMKRKKQLPCNGVLKCIRLSYDSLVALWLDNLEDKFYVHIEDVYSDGFCLDGLIEAFDNNYEHAMQYFWSRCSESEKEEFHSYLEDVIDFDNESYSANESNFLYSILSKEQKQIEIDIAKQNEGPFLLWSNLLHSRFYETVLEDIMSPSFCIPVAVYGMLLDLLAEEIIFKKLPIHKSIFKQIWNHLSNEEQMWILQMEEHRIFNLKSMISLNYLTINLP